MLRYTAFHGSSAVVITSLSLGPKWIGYACVWGVNRCDLLTSCVVGLTGVGTSFVAEVADGRYGVCMWVGVGVWMGVG